jgi:hypothetical protein
VRRKAGLRAGRAGYLTKPLDGLGIWYPCFAPRRLAEALGRKNSLLISLPS